MMDRMQRPPPAGRRRFTGPAVWIFLALGAVLLVSGSRRDLPWTPMIDEPTFVVRAMHMAATGDLNPHWFGHPGSTLIYPLAGLFALVDPLLPGGSLLDRYPDYPDFRDVAPLFFIARLLAVAYAFAALGLVIHLGTRLQDRELGLAGAALLLGCPTMLYYLPLARTDAAGLCFALAGMTAVFAGLERPTACRHLLAGACTGLAAATRYPLAALGPTLLYMVFSAPPFRASHPRLAKPGRAVLVLAAAGAVFVAVSPYTVLDFSTTWQNLIVEARHVHPGADGFGPAQNLLWYLGVALPNNLGWPLAAVSLVSLGFFMSRLRTSPRLTATAWFFGTYLLFLVWHPLHWKRWLIPLLPWFALAGAWGVRKILAWLSERFTGRPRRYRAAAVFLLAVVLATPAWNMVNHAVRNARRSTAILTLDWIRRHIPEGTPMAYEWQSAPLLGLWYPVLEKPNLALGKTLADYRRAGYRHLVVTRDSYRPYLGDPERYPQEANFYRSLFETAELLHEVKPTLWRAGARMRVYRLPD